MLKLGDFRAWDLLLLVRRFMVRVVLGLVVMYETASLDAAGRSNLTRYIEGVRGREQGIRQNKNIHFGLPICNPTSTKV
ncbi:hypothetical protein quinque_015011 [Culex quinquefasciatus]|uniref:Secreted protein n=1 Tax=Culex pipiens pipiens TaxID=38569 RepID=A0ABD1CE34_CULPP